jgi:hypothetical protein
VRRTTPTSCVEAQTDQIPIRRQPARNLRRSGPATSEGSTPKLLPLKTVLGGTAAERESVQGGAASAQIDRSHESASAGISQVEPNPLPDFSSTHRSRQRSAYAQEALAKGLIVA